MSVESDSYVVLLPVEGRLLHERDGLPLLDTSEIEMEALSNDAIILVIETNTK